MLANAWVMERFGPLEDIPLTVRPTTYHSGTTSAERSMAALQEIVDGVAARHFCVNLQRRLPVRRDGRGAPIHGSEPRQRQARGRC
jgi:hypothetical protein